MPPNFTPRSIIMPYETARDGGFLTAEQVKELEPQFRKALAAGHSVALQLEGKVLKLIAIED